MGIDDPKGSRLFLQIGQHPHQHDVLDDIGKAAGVKGVSVVHGEGLRHPGGESNHVQQAAEPSQPPRTGGITTSSRRQARRSISSQARNCRSLLRQTRTSLSRRLSQVTEIAELLRPGLTLMKASSRSPGAIGLRLRQLQEFFGDLHRRARLADGLEIGPRAEPRTGAVLVPFVEDQPGRRHQVEHRGHDVAIEPRRRPLAIFGKAALILRPQAVNHEGDTAPARTGPAVSARYCRARPPPRRTRATTTAPGRKNRTRPGRSAGGPARDAIAARSTTIKCQRNEQPRNNDRIETSNAPLLDYRGA